MVSEACGIDVGIGLHRRQEAAVKVARALGSQARLDRPPGKLVPEAKHPPIVHHHGGSHGVVDGPILDAEVSKPCPAQSPWLDRRELEQLTAPRRKPGDAGEDGIAHGRGDIGRRRCQHLRDVEGVPAGDRVERIGIDLVSGRQLPDGTERERLHATPDEPGRREVAEDGAQRMAGIDLVVAH